MSTAIGLARPSAIESFDGIARIKDQFRIAREPRQNPNESKTAEHVTIESLAEGAEELKGSPSEEPASKKSRPNNPEHVNGRRGDKKDRGMNTKRTHVRISDPVPLCSSFGKGSCGFGEKCKFSHDAAAYLQAKGEDISGTCPIYDVRGSCDFGLRCRFLSAHSRPVSEGEAGLGNSGLVLLQKEVEKPVFKIGSVEIEFLKLLKKRDKYILPKSKAFLNSTDNQTRDPNEREEADHPDVKPRPAEKTRLQWKEKLYLAPLTTVGNLPFRQLCSELGADITCAEMGLAHSFNTGQSDEWSLARRGAGEKCFGVQIAGNKTGVLVPAAEAIANQSAALGGIDFVDLNAGCPIDMVCSSGGGSMLLDNANKLKRCLKGMHSVLGDIPLTIKMRTAIREDKLLAHTLMPQAVVHWGASAATLHGRSRKMRYSKMADWSYIKKCVEEVRAMEEEYDLPPAPIIGNGDINCPGGYYEQIEASGVDCVMLARGALIKPWLFTEIKERRDWDISSRERLDLIQKFVNFGLQHWGSDTMGVNTTRRFLCEALSFQHRYVPLGLLERLPIRMNERPEPYIGRNDLETLLGSTKSEDWVKITEMFLGKSPDAFSFTPKHKSNSYGNDRDADEDQG